MTRLRDETQDLIMSVSGKEIRRDLAKKIIWFVQNLNRWKYSKRGIGNCGREDFSEGVGQVGKRYVQGFHDPDTPQQEIGTASSTARSCQEFGPRRNQWVKMVGELHAGTFSPVVLAQENS